MTSCASVRSQPPGRKLGTMWRLAATGVGALTRIWRASGAISPTSYSLVFTETYEKIERHCIALELEPREQEIILVSVGGHGEVC
jgi:hypothetical protein